MRIAWFDPFDPDAPAAAFIARVAAAMAAKGRHAVIIRRPGEPDHAAPPGAVEVRSWRDRREAHDVTLSFHSFGGDVQAREAAGVRLARHPGVAILHDMPEGDPAALSMGEETLIARNAYGVVAANGAQRERLARCCPSPVIVLAPPQPDEPVEAYACALLALGEQALALSPLSRMARVLAGRLADMGVPADDPLIDRVVQASDALFPISAGPRV